MDQSEKATKDLSLICSRGVDKYPFYKPFFVGEITTPIYKLENDPMCGMTTGGKEECFWDCNIDSKGIGNGPLISSPECLLNCFPEVII